MNMNLRDYVNEKIEDGVVFNIGNGGSGWIFCGTKKEFNMHIELISKDYAEKYENYYKDAEHRIEATEIKGRRRANIFVKGSAKKVKEDEELWKARILKSIDELPAIIEKRFKLYYKAKERYLSFVPFQDRMVKKTYTTDITGTLCVMIEGRDPGVFWTVEEFNKIYKNGHHTKYKIDWFSEEENEEDGEVGIRSYDTDEMEEEKEN